MSGVPYVFGNATTSIPLSQLDVNFATNATIGTTSVGLGNTTTTLVGLTNVSTTVVNTSNVSANTSLLLQTNGTTAVTIDNTQVATFANTLKAPNLQGPAFSAYPSSNQSITSNTLTNVSSNTKLFDTGNCFNNTGSSTTLNGLTAPAYSFVPNVAGYYQLTGYISFGGTVTGTSFITLFKNGSRFQDGNYSTGVPTLVGVYVSYLIYLNGTGDYIQLYGVETGTSTAFNGGTNSSYFQAVFVRSA